MHGGQLESRFFARKISEVEPIWLHFGPLMEGTCAHSPDIFGRLLILVTREIVDFRRNFGIFSCQNGPRYSCQNFIPDVPWGSPCRALKKLAPSPKIFFEIWGKLLWGWAAQAAVGVRGRPGTASGGRCRSPLPGAPSGDPTPITPSVEELVLPTPFVDFVVTPLARLGKHGFLDFKLGKV